MNVVRVDLRSPPMLVKINLLDESYHKNASSSSPSPSCNFNPCSPSTEKSFHTRCTYSLSSHVSPQSPSVNQNFMSISPQSRLNINSVSHFLQPASPANINHGNDEETLQRQIEMQALQNLELREQLQREKTRTHLVISQNLSMKQQLDSAQKKLKEIESLQFLKKSVCPSTPIKAPSSQLTSSSKFRVEKTIQKTLRKSTNLFKGDLSQSFTTSKRSTQYMNQQQLNTSKNFRDYQVSCINQNKNYQMQENNINNQDSNSRNNWAQVLPQQQPNGFGQITFDNSQNNSILDILNCLKEEQQNPQQGSESLGESFLKDLHNIQSRPSTKLAVQNQRTSQVIAKPRSRKGLVQPFLEKIRI